MRWTSCALGVAVLLALAAEAAADCGLGEINIDPFGFGGQDCKNCGQKKQCRDDECWAKCDGREGGNCVVCERPGDAECMDDGRQECTRNPTRNPTHFNPYPTLIPVPHLPYTLNPKSKTLNSTLTRTPALNP